MKCAQARKLFGAYWDDEITQGEREWLESHLNGCDPCRTEYEAFARSIELVGSLPREEAAPDMVDRIMARARRAAPASDRLPERRVHWVPVTAAAAAVVLVLTLVLPRAGWFPGSSSPGPVASNPQLEEVLMPERVAVSGQTVAEGGSPATSEDGGSKVDAKAPDQFMALSADSLFDHSEDVEFILDPVALRRGRAHPLPVSRAADGVQLERAVITF